MGEGAHEDFVVLRVFTPNEWDRKERGKHFYFCKTARKPYDVIVCACLIVFQHYFGKDFLVSSDGEDDEQGWPEARRYCQEVLGYGKDFTLEEAIRCTKLGLPYEDSWYEGEVHYRLAGGWVIEGKSAEARYLNLVTPQGKVLASGRFSVLRWLATCEYVREMLKPLNLPDLDGFIESAKELGEWTPLLALTDRVTEVDSSRIASNFRLFCWQPKPKKGDDGRKKAILTFQ